MFSSINFSQNIINNKFRLLFIVFTSILMSTIASLIIANTTHAAFSAGNIIDDATFTNYNSMNASQIQQFLNSKNSVCLMNYRAPSLVDDNGDGIVQDTTTETYGRHGTMSAAELINAAAKIYRINPQVLLVTLQKEQGLITRSDCPDWRYRTALGYACPDNGACSAFGFTKQIDYGAYHFRGYFDDTLSYVPFGVGSYNIGYSPDGACGSSVVNIQNRATASLYSYTPYQPNAAALAAGYGEAPCGAYGNRNFYLYFTSWFNPIESIRNGITMTTVAQPHSAPAIGQSITYTVSFRNNLSENINVDAVGIVGRLGSLNGSNRDLGWQGPITLQPGVTQTYTFTTTVRDVGTIYAWPALNIGGQYIQYNNWGMTLNTHAPNFSFSQPLTTNPSSVYAGQDVTFSTVIKNNEPYSINYDAIGIPVKFYDRYNYDATWAGPGTLAPGAEMTLSGVRNIDTPGTFTYWASMYYGGTYLNIGSVKRFDAADVTPNFTVSGLNLSSTTLAQGENLTASFTVKNNLPVAIDVDGVGVVGRYGSVNGQNRDLGWQGATHFNAGETKTFSGYSRAITDVGNHYFWIGIANKGNYVQYNNWGSTVVSLAPSFTVSGLTLSSATPTVGQNLTASFTVKNNLSVPIDVDGVGVVGRYGSISGPNRDLGWQGPAHFNAGETKAFSGYSRAITDTGNHYYWISVVDGGRYLQYNNWGSTVVSH